jgi:hypothetical protein
MAYDTMLADRIREYLVGFPNAILLAGQITLVL